MCKSGRARFIRCRSDRMEGRADLPEITRSLPFDNAVDAMTEKLENYGLRSQDIIIALKASASGAGLKANPGNIQKAFSSLASARIRTAARPS
jgi:hypothetical protein